jgi:hypothetical protein
MSGIQGISVSATQSYASVGTQGQPSLQPFSNLNLTEAQRTQLRSIFTAAKQNGTSQADVAQQINAVLTPAQQQTAAADLKAGGSGHHHHHHSDADAGSAQTAATPAAASSTPTTTATVLSLVTNVQNQAAAAKSTLIETLQKQVLATNNNASTANDATGDSASGDTATA